MTTSTSARDDRVRQSVAGGDARLRSAPGLGARAATRSAQATSRAVAERRGALPADQAAADDRDARRTHRSPHAEAAVLRDDAAQRVDVGAVEIVAVRWRAPPTDPRPR